MSSEQQNDDEAYEVLPTACVTWSLNRSTADGDASGLFWWNSEYSISVWHDVLALPAATDAAVVAAITDDDVWRCYYAAQLAGVVLVCVTCHAPNDDDDDDDDAHAMGLCCLCGSVVHARCARVAREAELALRPANAAFASRMRVCAACDGAQPTAHDEATRRPHTCMHVTAAAVCSAVRRLRSMGDELPDSVMREVGAVFAAAQALRAGAAVAAHEQHAGDSKDTQAAAHELMLRLRRVMRAHLQSPLSLECFARVPVAAKGGGVGVVALRDVPAFVIVGVYPGYTDRMSGEHARLGRPTPKYALMHLNCADYHNRVYAELQDALTPYINEPAADETSNCAWLQEPCRPQGRLSVMTVRSLRAGEELLIGYGPQYPRTYTYRYDAYACQSVDGHNDPPCLALWHWTSADVASATFVCYVGYDAAQSRYFHWETSVEAEAAASAARATHAQAAQPRT